MDQKNHELIVKIVKRAEEKGLLLFDRISLIMDIEHVTEKFNLRLKELLATDDFNFAHDICGIQNNFNRETLEMENCFLPRFAG